MNAYDQTAVQERRLRYLAAYLTSVPDDYESFDMGTFAAHDEQGVAALFLKEIDPGEYAQRTHPCGTVACAIGHAPLLGFRVYQFDEYENLAERIFGHEFSSDTKLWDWMFDAGWAEFDNTPHGAAQRIIFMLNLNDRLKMLHVCREYSRLWDDELSNENRRKAGKEWVAATYRHVVVPTLDQIDTRGLPKVADILVDQFKAGQPLFGNPEKESV